MRGEPSTSSVGNTAESSFDAAIKGRLRGVYLPVHSMYWPGVPETVSVDRLKAHTHKVHIYLEYQRVCSLVRIGTSPPPSPSLPPERKGGGETRSPAGDGVGGGGLQFGRLEKKPSTLSARCPHRFCSP
jgi:hypothetical protein